MVEVVAENYHNIWAKKKKLELESKGEPGSRCPLQEGSWGCGRYIFPEVQRKGQRVGHLSLSCPQVAAVTLCWYHMTP